MNLNDYKLKDRSNAAMHKLIKQNVTHRQALKKKWDRNCKYSSENMPAEATGRLEFAGKVSDANLNAKGKDNFVRLLDEGVVVEGDGSVYAVIKKGVIKKWYDSLPDDFVGNIDKDHNRSIDLGVFRKSDLKLVELEADRYGVDVNVKLDDELSAVKDLKHMGNRNAISSEFWSEENEFIKQSVITGSKKSVYGFDYLVPLIDEIQITGYAVVDNPKNANSYDEGLLTEASTEKDVTMTKEELKKLAAEGDEEAKAKLAELEAAEGDDADPSNEGDAEGDTDDATDDADATDASAGGDAADDDATDGDDTDEGDDKGTDEGDDATEGDDADETDAAAEKIEKAINDLRAQVAEKDAKIAELEAKLSAKEQSRNAFMAKLESALDFTTAVEPAADEGGAEPTPEKTEGDEVADAYAAAFADLQ